jgi:1,6-anhydro-N-acetylmuramate kinase
VKFGGQIYSLIFIFKTRNPNNMVYRAIGIMSGSALEGLDIVFAEFHERAGVWTYATGAQERYSYSAEWEGKLKKASSLSAQDYLELHAAYGHYIGAQVNHFIEAYQLQYKVQLVASHGHTVFHTVQLGEGAAIAAETGINVVCDFYAMDVALGGSGNQLMSVGEKLLFADHTDEQVVLFKEPLIIALLGLLRWREENNMLAANTGASRDSIGGAVWIGQDA